MLHDRLNRVSSTINDMLSGLSNTSSEQCISKVHDRLRRHNKEAYEPHVLSIGPYHYGDRNLVKMETYKLRYLQELLVRRGESSADRYISALMELEDRARRCYAEGSNWGPFFVITLCLDGLFIIEFLRKFRMPELRNRNDTILQMGWLNSAILRDLILFENQIPFFILNQLFEMTRLDEKDDIIQLGLGICYLIKGIGPKKNYAIKTDEVSHLLDLVHKGWCSSFASTISEINDYGIGSLEYIKSATDLRKSSVKIRSAANYKSWLDITFKKGIINVPTLTVDDFTESILRNLIAYELYMSNYNRRSYVTDYVKFMDLLIDSKWDVGRLRRHTVIINQVGDDEVVSNMFNKLLSDITVNDWKFCYSRVFEEVNEYSSSRWNRWRGHCVVWVDQLMKSYFSSPWSIISFLAAVVLLILTVVQTIFSILAVNKGK